MQFYLVTSLENITSGHFGRDGVASCNNSVTCRAWKSAQRKHGIKKLSGPGFSLLINF